MGLSDTCSWTVAYRKLASKQLHGADHPTREGVVASCPTAASLVLYASSLLSSSGTLTPP